MVMCDRCRMLLPMWLLVLAWPVTRVDTAPPRDEALRQIPKLSHAQVALIAGNATARCQLTPELCDWQLQLYEGHGFSIQLPLLQHNGNHNGASTTTSTTSAPRVEAEAAAAVGPLPIIFALPAIDETHKLLIYAQVERKVERRRQGRPKVGKSQRRKLLAKLSQPESASQLRSAYANRDGQVQKIRFAA